MNQQRMMRPILPNSNPGLKHLLQVNTADMYNVRARE